MANKKNLNKTELQKLIYESTIQYLNENIEEGRRLNNIAGALGKGAGWVGKKINGALDGARDMRDSFRFNYARSVNNNGQNGGQLNQGSAGQAQQNPFNNFNNGTASLNQIKSEYEEITKLYNEILNIEKGSQANNNQPSQQQAATGNSSGSTTPQANDNGSGESGSDNSIRETKEFKMLKKMIKEGVTKSILNELSRGVVDRDVAKKFGFFQGYRNMITGEEYWFKYTKDPKKLCNEMNLLGFDSVKNTRAEGVYKVGVIVR